MQNMQAVYQAMRQLTAGVQGYAFLGQPAEAVNPLFQGVMTTRRLDVFQRSPGAIALNRPQISRVVAGTIVGGTNLQPLSQFNQRSRNYAIPGVGG